MDHFQRSDQTGCGEVLQPFLRIGDRAILLTADGRTVAGEVYEASLNGRWLLVATTGMVEGWIGVVSLYWSDDGRWRTGNDAPVGLRRPPGYLPEPLNPRWEAWLDAALRNAASQGLTR